ncbi:hypothetical protein HQ585_15335 [candidate division KSB1 bacterium]|nr:hypothetical protein [candidate division KSB1 bacterium]
MMSNIKWNIGIFYFTGGVGFSYQNNDDIRYLEETQYHTKSIFIHTKSKTVIAGLFGCGFDVHIYNGFSLLAEGDLFFREPPHAGAAWLLGIKYSLNEI